MCLAVPGEVKVILGKKALIATLGVEREASIELLKDVKVGDYVIVHAGCAIAKVDEGEALETIKLFKELEELKYE